MVGFISLGSGSQSMARCFERRKPACYTQRCLDPNRGWNHSIVARVLIIADDLTGAADCGVMFRECGVEAMVVLCNPGRNAMDASELRSVEVVALDGDTRCLGAAQAEDAVRQLLLSCDTWTGFGGDRPLLFKKVDSTLRGNVAVELAAALRTTREMISPPARVGVLFAPAFPALGRTTLNGRQLLNGLPLGETELWSNELTRPHEDIAQMLGEAGLTSSTIDLALVRGEMNVLKSAMVREANRVDVLVCDAEIEDDLQAVAQAAMELDVGTIWAGSAGLARHMANAAGISEAVRSTPAQICERRLEGPALFVVGSQAMASREQADALASAPDLACYRITARMLDAKQLSEWDEHATRIMRNLADGRDVLVRLDPIKTCEYTQDRSVARSVAQMLAPCAAHVGALVATGGDTARAILDRWEIERLTLLGEVEPGLPYSVATCGNREILALTKAGGFGMRDTLVRCREFLCKLGRDSNAAESQHPLVSWKD